MAKKNNKRKYAAIALGIVGIAGLTMASASNLAITSGPNIATGTTTIAAACDDAIAVAYPGSFNSTSHLYEITGVTFTGINAACVGKTLTFVLHYNTTSEIAPTARVLVTADSATAGYTYTLPTALSGATTTLDRIDATIN